MTINKKLTESFISNFNYEVPKYKDVKKLLYDFYFTTIYLYGAALNEGNKGSGFGQKGITTKDLDDAEVENLKLVTKECVDNLKNHFRNIVRYSISCEFRHVFDGTVSHLITGMSELPDDVKQVFYAYDAEKAVTKGSIISNNPLIATSDPNKFTQRRPLKREINNASERQKAYAIFRSIQKKYGFSDSLMGEACAYGFDPDIFNWSSGYGGEPWKNIALGYKKLMDSKTLDSDIVWIDHIYDLQHNNNTLFDKLKVYSQDGGYTWLEKALDWKRDVRTIQEYENKVSGSLRPLVRWAAGRDVGLEDQYNLSSDYTKSIVEENLAPKDERIKLDAPFIVKVESMSNFNDVYTILSNKGFSFSGGDYMKDITDSLSKYKVAFFGADMAHMIKRYNKRNDSWSSTKKLRVLDSVPKGVPIYTLENIQDYKITNLSEVEDIILNKEFSLMINNSEQAEKVYNFITYYLKNINSQKTPSTSSLKVYLKNKGGGFPLCITSDGSSNNIYIDSAPIIPLYKERPQLSMKDFTKYYDDLIEKGKLIIPSKDATPTVSSNKENLPPDLQKYADYKFKPKDYTFEIKDNNYVVITNKEEYEAFQNYIFGNGHTWLSGDKTPLYLDTKSYPVTLAIEQGKLVKAYLDKEYVYYTLYNIPSLRNNFLYLAPLHEGEAPKAPQQNYDSSSILEKIKYYGNKVAVKINNPDQIETIMKATNASETKISNFKSYYDDDIVQDKKYSYYIFITINYDNSIDYSYLSSPTEEAEKKNIQVYAIQDGYTVLTFDNLVSKAKENDALIPNIFEEYGKVAVLIENEEQLENVMRALGATANKIGEFKNSYQSAVDNEYYSFFLFARPLSNGKDADFSYLENIDNEEERRNLETYAKKVGYKIITYEDLLDTSSPEEKEDEVDTTYFEYIKNKYIEQDLASDNNISYEKIVKQIEAMESHEISRVSFIVEDSYALGSLLKILDQQGYSFSGAFPGYTLEEIIGEVEDYPILIYLSYGSKIIVYSPTSEEHTWRTLIKPYLYSTTYALVISSKDNINPPSEYEDDPQPELGEGGEPIPVQKKKQTKINLYDILPIAVKVDNKNEWRELDKMMEAFGIGWESKNDVKNTQTYPEYFPYFIGITEHGMKHSKTSYEFTKKGLKVVTFNTFKNMYKRLEV